HSLIQTKIIRPYFGHLQPRTRNSLVAPFCLTYAALVSSIAVFQYTNTGTLMIAWLISFFLYFIIYVKLKGLKIPVPKDNHQLFQQ
ncbi:MAG: hypothetical protein WCP33_04900, partial [Deltaproteobacteria bacterium]